MSINSVRELVDALKEAQGFSEEIGVMGISVNVAPLNGIRVQLESINVLNAIPTKLESRETGWGDYPQELSKEVDGVTFFCLVPAVEWVKEKATA